MRTLKTFFLGRVFREKLLLVVFVGLGTVMWLSNFSGRAGRFWRTERAVVSNLAEQKQWLASRAAIEAGAQQAIKKFEPERTLDETKLVGELSAMARDHNLKFTNDTPQTQSSGEFAVHTVQISLQTRGQDAGAEWNALKEFYLAIGARSPYLGIEQFALAADRANPARLNVSLRVSSVEILQ